MKCDVWCVALLLLAIAGSAAAETINVPGDYDQIHDAVQAANAGDVVLVAAGTYNDCTHETEGPGSTPACVIMASGVTLRGSGPDATIIDAQGLGRGIFVENVSDCSIENLQVTGAFAEVYGAGILVREVDDSVAITDVKIFQNGDGGIICINNAHPVLTRVEFIDNVAKQGGGLAIEDGSDTQVIDCLVQGNEAPSGAGIFIRNGSRPRLLRCTVIANTITADFGNGGGILAVESAPTIESCNISDNTTLGLGGGVAFTNGSTGSLSACLISGNDAAGSFQYGGGIAVNQSSPRLEYLTVVNNTCSGFGADGGGIDISFLPAPTIRRCTFAGNGSSGDEGTGAGGVLVQFDADPLFENCIIAASTVGAGIFCPEFFPGYPTFVGCDVWGNAGGDELSGTDGGCNFSADPLFCGSPGLEWNLQSGSPCLPGNHPGGGGCGEETCGAVYAGCSATPVDETPAAHEVVLGNRPNPFNPQTFIFFVLPERGPATVRILDLRGRAVRTFRFADLPAGQRRELTWDGRDNDGRALPSGVYFYRLESGDLTQTRSMSLIR